MRKNAIQTRVFLTGVIGLLAQFSGMVYAAPLFVPPSPPIVGYVAQPELSHYDLTTGNESVFRGEYERTGWSGNLSCYAISAAGNVNTSVPCWSSGTGASLKVGAQSQVDLQGYISGSRNIATLGLTGVPQAFALAADPTDLIDASHVNYIRGDRSNEAPAGLLLRPRFSVLGDTIHSRPFYITDSTNSNPTIFYGGNDGMLHAIDATQATGGKERWAYIPSMLVPNLGKLWANPYVHQDFVDGSVNIINAGTSTVPKNILVGVLGAGGKGMYALNVTTLTAVSDTDVANKFLWEITPTSITTNTGGRVASTSYANLGYTYSNPSLAPIKINGGTVNAVIVGNGYNNTGNGHATLLVIDVLTGNKLAEIDTGIAGIGGPNGLSTPAAVDSNGDGAVDTVYAGDIDGNMWKFNLGVSPATSTPSSWTATKLYATGQSITMMPGVAAHPYGGYMVDFATGRILTAADAVDTSVYYAYGIWDGAPAASVAKSPQTLANQTITVRQYTPAPGATPVTVRVVGATPASAAVVPNWGSGGDIGWKAALPVIGERVTGDTAFDQFGRFFFNATNPTVPYSYTPSGGTAITGNGVNWLMELDYLTGGNANTPFFDMNSDGLLNDADRVQYVASDTIPSPSVVGNPIMTSFGIPVGYFTTYGVQSQPALGGVGSFSATFYNSNWDVQPAATPATSNTSTTGVGGGHFDVDAWYKGLYGNSLPSTHTHEYDKIYDVNGVNLLNPNETDKRLSNAKDLVSGAAITATTPYKVLLMNQSWNRAMFLTLGKTIWSTKDYLTGPTSAGVSNASGGYNATYSQLWSSIYTSPTGSGPLKMASLPTYTGISSTVTGYTTAPSTAPTPIFGRITVTNVSTTGSIGCGGFLNGVAINAGCTTTSVTTGVRQADAANGVGGFEVSMPSTAFQVLDWWGDGVKQTGVMPTFYACPGNSLSSGAEQANGTGNGQQYRGVLGERNDGTLTVQVVKDTTPDSAVQLNVPGRPDLGFRVTDAQFKNYVLDEITIYWHHPMAVCYGDTSSTWKVSNNSGDPWWPAQETGNGAGTTGTTFGTKPDGSPLICNNSNNSNSNPAWSSTAPAVWTNPPGWKPKGFTITPPLDTETTLPLCPQYSALRDDPRTASFVTSTAGTSSSQPVVASTSLQKLPVNSVGGMAVITPNTSCVGGSCTSCVGAGCQTTTACSGTACNPCGTAGQPACNQVGKSAGTGRISWHELIRQ